MYFCKTASLGVHDEHSAQAVVRPHVDKALENAAVAVAALEEWGGEGRGRGVGVGKMEKKHSALSGMWRQGSMDVLT